MIFGTLRLGETALHTHNDSYVLEGIKAVSTRRPFLSAGLVIGTLVAGFTISFSDILYLGEIAALIVTGFLSIIGGLSIGRLQLVSRDLTGSPIADAVYGTYGHLNRLRPLIADAVERAKTGGAS
ncbi:hypothetical protein [Pseudophaeobacter sp.]|uniref:hypothetical protein n=1 Tax=Pseudophaeobacter sp. TaxID=1971739 RepID=UPI00260A528B|nr:hypothetical protein [Pseudophaeobacter sp.]